jgi:hypothetical protein
VGIEPATFGLLVYCSTNWATKSRRFECSKVGSNALTTIESRAIDQQTKGRGFDTHRGQAIFHLARWGYIQSNISQSEKSSQNFVPCSQNLFWIHAKLQLPAPIEKDVHFDRGSHHNFAPPNQCRICKRIRWGGQCNFRVCRGYSCTRLCQPGSICQ